MTVRQEDGTETSTSLWFKAKTLFGSFRPVYWQALAVIVVLYFARFDPSFLMLRAKQVWRAALTQCQSLLAMYCPGLLSFFLLDVDMRFLIPMVDVQP